MMRMMTRIVPRDRFLRVRLSKQRLCLPASSAPTGLAGGASALSLTVIAGSESGKLAAMVRERHAQPQPRVPPHVSEMQASELMREAARWGSALFVKVMLVSAHDRADREADDVFEPAANLRMLRRSPMKSR